MSVMRLGMSPPVQLSAEERVSPFSFRRPKHTASREGTSAP